MAAKKKTNKRHSKPSKTAVSKNVATKSGSRAKKAAKNMSALKKAVVKTKAPRQKNVVAKETGSARKRTIGRKQRVDSEGFASQSVRTRSARQSGDLQGLSNVEGADSESVGELMEEGNAFEADVVAGVQSAGDAEEKEVRTHEVPEDDVPGEYLDKE